MTVRAVAAFLTAVGVCLLVPVCLRVPACLAFSARVFAAFMWAAP